MKTEKEQKPEASFIMSSIRNTFGNLFFVKNRNKKELNDLVQF